METEKPNAPDHILRTPTWMLVIRGIKVFLSLIILAMAAKLMHEAYLDEHGFALATSLFTWIVVGYTVLSERLPSLQGAYNIIAVIALDGLMMILWLAAFAAMAAERARYTQDVSVSSCNDDGSAISSVTCSRKRAVILFEGGKILMATISGLGAMNWLLFIATLVWEIIMFQRGRKEGRFTVGAGNDNYQMSPKPSPVQQQQQQQQLMSQQQQQQPPAQQPIQSQNTGQYQHQPMQHQPTGHYQHQPSPAGTYSPPPAGTYPPPAQYPAGNYQPPVSPHPGSPQHQAGPYSPPSELSSQGHQYAPVESQPPPPQTYYEAPNQPQQGYNHQQ